jgi:hypothetical protein
MPPAPRSGLGRTDPRVGQTLSFEGREWEVTDHSSYWDDEGYRVVEWCCECDDVEAYLLKEVREGEPDRWFFTRAIPRQGVGMLPAAGTTPPPALTYEGRTYRFEEKTEGTYEEDPGQREQKTTWEYWDDGRRHNLAVELWADGRLECYHGAYIEPGEVTLAEDSAGSGAREERETPDATLAAGSAARLAVAAERAKRQPAVPVFNPFITAVGILPFIYFVPFFFFGRPFDESLAVALPLALLFAWLFTRVPAPGALWVGLLGILVVGLAFWKFHPLTNPAGVATLVGAPAVVGAWGRRHGARGRRAVVYVAALVVGLPALVLGFYHYFTFAPGPHGLDQLALALGPAVLGAVAAMLIARVVLSGADPDPDPR